MGRILKKTSKEAHQYMPFRWSIDKGKLRIFLEKFRDLIFQEIFMFGEIYNLYKQKKTVEARLFWHKTHGGDIPNFGKDKVDLFGSEAKQFFEVIQETKVGKIERAFHRQQS